MRSKFTIEDVRDQVTARDVLVEVVLEDGRDKAKLTDFGVEDTLEDIRDTVARTDVGLEDMIEDFRQKGDAYGCWGYRYVYEGLACKEHLRIFGMRSRLQV